MSFSMSLLSVVLQWYEEEVWKYPLLVEIDGNVDGSS